MKLSVISLLVAFSALSVAHAEEPNTRTLTETYQDWQVVCVEQEKQSRCEARQQLVNPNRQTVAMISLGKDAEGKGVLQFALPLLMDLTQPMVVHIDGKKAGDFAYRFCSPAACFIQVDEKNPLLAAFRKGTQGELTLTPMGQKGMGIPFSLKGFSAAESSLNKR